MSAACTLSGTPYTYDDLIALERKNATLAKYIKQCNTLYGVSGDTLSNTNRCTITISGANMGNVRLIGQRSPDTLTKDNFDWEAYISKYGDLRSAGINTLDTAWNHYTKNGRKENRIATLNTEENKTTATLHEEMVRNNKIISACIPTPSPTVIGTERQAGNELRSEYDKVKANRAKADALKRELAPEHRYTRETQFEDPLYLATLNAEWNGWSALVFAAAAGTILVYAFISSSSSTK